ncbi:MAG: DUF4160 domain-containing protein [Cyclobacteriaceae bacterium]
MGKLLILAKYIFLIYGSDIHETRRHIHITHARRGYKKSCKFWLEPEIQIDENKKGEFTSKELKEIEKLIHEHKGLLLQQLDEFYKGKPVTAIRL